MEQEG